MKNKFKDKSFKRVSGTDIDWEILSKSEMDLNLVRPIKNGKDGSVWLLSCQDKFYIWKQYHDPIRQKNQISHSKFLAGTKIDEKFKKISKAKTLGGRNFVLATKVKREFNTLQNLHKAEVNVPQVYFCSDTGFLMQALADDQNTAMKISELTDIDFAKLWDLILVELLKMWNLGFVHGDLSVFNILFWQEKIWLIDFPQAVDVRFNPKALEIAHRDFFNLYGFFKKYLTIDAQQTWNETRQILESKQKPSYRKFDLDDYETFNLIN